ncbi:HIT family protein [Exiguobacterium sp. ERU656]|uniref:HIT family protein n=1 Tax=Exiguobacterium sp. ERU656 TaxID=2751217 RepID=UPI001BE6BE21|nr:HIT family protein [Exiguobacterium sp. ERU656]
MQKDNCIFCKIAKHEVPSHKVFENDEVLAFLDLSQVTKGHTLIIPKQHADHVYDLSVEDAQSVFAVVPEISRALQKETQAAGINILSNTGKVAGQSVSHFHIHLIPRHDKHDGFGAKWEVHNEDYTAEELAILVNSISTHL